MAINRRASLDFATLKRKADISHAKMVEESKQLKALAISQRKKMTNEEAHKRINFVTMRKIVRTAKGHAISRGGLMFRDINALNFNEHITRMLARVDYTLKDRQFGTAGEILGRKIMPELFARATESLDFGKSDQRIMKLLGACDKRLERIIKMAEKANQLGQLVKLLPLFEEYHGIYLAEIARREKVTK